MKKSRSVNAIPACESAALAVLHVPHPTQWYSATSAIQTPPVSRSMVRILTALALLRIGTSAALPGRRVLPYHDLDMTDAALLAARWAHSIAAVAWVGGGIFYLLVLRPAVTNGALPSDSARATAERFGGLVKLAMWTLVVTGAVLFFTRISEPTATARYAAVLGLKVALSAWMFFIAVRRRRRIADAVAVKPGRIRAVAAALGHVNTVVILGAAIFLLSDVLRYIVEQELGG
ncbi:MAG: hypothetical protein OXE50_00770 [Chloroflexi bacterium]|nr:hypothetical protein [Chloroflexota bacterium]